MSSQVFWEGNKQGLHACNSTASKSSPSVAFIFNNKVLSNLSDLCLEVSTSWVFYIVPLSL
jgi:hypothetical protein